MKLQPFQKRTWANIDLDAAKHNFRCIRSKLSKDTKLCCVVKANGYGHGAVQLSKLYEKLGANYLAVSNIEEAIQLRNGGINIPILILGYTNPCCAVDLAKYQVSQCVFSFDYGRELSFNASQQNVNVKIHIKLDTGMGRIGFQCVESELNQVDEVCRLPRLEAEGIFTHFASADEGDGGRDYTYEQFRKFLNSINYLEKKGISFFIRHCANSAGIFDYPDMHLDMVRAGIVLYGLQPSRCLKNPGELQPLMELKTIIDQIKIIHPGDCISYGREFRANRSVRVATLPIGYADGLRRSNYKNNILVKVGEHLSPLIGRICMDQCMIDVTNNPNAKVNSEVIVYGGNGEMSVDHIASINQTINYEIVCALGERVPRVYTENGQIVSIVDNIV